jgi:hypothetical protein
MNATEHATSPNFAFLAKRIRLIRYDESLYTNLARVLNEEPVQPPLNGDVGADPLQRRFTVAC